MLPMLVPRAPEGSELILVIAHHDTWITSAMECQSAAYLGIIVLWCRIAANRKRLVGETSHRSRDGPGLIQPLAPARPIPLSRKCSTFAPRKRLPSSQCLKYALLLKAHAVTILLSLCIATVANHSTTVLEIRLRADDLAQIGDSEYIVRTAYILCDFHTHLSTTRRACPTSDDQRRLQNISLACAA
jgi:hypothetical protein